MYRKSLALLSAVGLVLGLAGCSPAKPDTVPSADDASAAVTVLAYDNAYEPAEVEIQVGEAVKWEFTGNMKHDVVAEDGSFVSELVDEGTYTVVFDEPGEYAYDCSVHPEMRGVVRVVE
ncbi:MAG: cupredoxin domain-containing protein [Leucobacter sp.]